MKGIAGKNVLVTGGSSGIGQAIAVRFGHDGANVAINYRRNPDQAEETAGLVDAAVERCVDEVGRCGVRTTLIQADVSDAGDVARMVRAAIEALGDVDILVNNAGIQVAGASHEVEPRDFDRVVGVNLRGAFLCARETIRHWIERARAGIVINISSVHEIIPKPNYLSYSVSKGGLGNLTRTLALEYAPRGIRVNAVAPGATVTPINRAWADDPEKRAEVERHVPLGRAGTAEEMAAAVAFLCSDDAAYITGQTLFVDGGLTLYPDFRTPWSSE